jgi:hypothetical protein
MNIGATIIPNAESAKLVQTPHRPFHHPAEDAQSAGVFVVSMGD